MSRIFLTLFACASLIGLSVRGSLQAQEVVPSIAVLPLQGNNVYGERTRMLGHRLRKLLARKYSLPQVDYALVDSSRMFECQNVQCAVEKGRLLKVDQVMYGQILNQQSTFRLQLTLVNTHTGKKIREVSESCNYCDFTQVLKSLAPEVLDGLSLAKGEIGAGDAGPLSQWENHVGNDLTFDYPAELDLMERAHSHRNGIYLYMLSLKSKSPFFLSIVVSKRPDTSSFVALRYFKDRFLEENMLEESKKVNYSLGNKQVEGIPYISKSGSGDDQSKGVIMMFEGNVNVYQIQLQTSIALDAETDATVREFFKNFLKTVYVG